MRTKAMIASALAAMALSGAFASGAGAQGGVFLPTHNGPIPAHVVQTPTGPMTIPDSLTETTANGTVHGVACSYATEAMASHYTHGEIVTDAFNWCFEEPGSIVVDEAKVQESDEYVAKQLENKAAAKQRLRHQRQLKQQHHKRHQS